MRRFFYYTLILLSSTITLWSQDTLTLNKFKEVVLTYHPVAQQAEIILQLSDAEQMRAKGNLDPKLSGGLSTKSFDNKRYFQYWNGQVNIPTRTPLSFDFGYEQSDGVFLNPEATLPTHGLFYGGVNLSLLRGLLFDKTRFELQDASYIAIENTIQAEIILNELLYHAITSYINWSKAAAYEAIAKDFLQQLQERHEFTKELYINGSAPAIDTIESSINVLKAQSELYTASISLQKAKQSVNMFLWDESRTPLELLSNVRPEWFFDLFNSSIGENNILQELTDDNPLMRQFSLASKRLQLKQRLLKENLKPDLDLQFRPLLSLGDASNQALYHINDYKFGAKFAYPILNRKARSDLTINALKQESLDLKMLEKQNELQQKISFLTNALTIQFEAYQTMLQNEQLTQTLLEAETFKFELGESSVFLLNQRLNNQFKAKLDTLKFAKAYLDSLNEQRYLLFTL